MDERGERYNKHSYQVVKVMDEVHQRLQHKPFVQLSAAKWVHVGASLQRLQFPS